MLYYSLKPTKDKVSAVTMNESLQVQAKTLKRGAHSKMEIQSILTSELKLTNLDFVQTEIDTTDYCLFKPEDVSLHAKLC